MELYYELSQEHRDAINSVPEELRDKIIDYTCCGEPRVMVIRNMRREMIDRDN